MLEQSINITCPHCAKSISIDIKNIKDNYECGWCDKWIHIQLDGTNIIVTAMFEPDVYK